MSISSSELPSMGRLRDRAERLLKQMRSRDLAAARQFQTHHPGFGTSSTDDLFAQKISLLDAQLVVARMNGFSNWPELKHHFEEKERDEAANDVVMRDALTWIHGHPNATLLSLPYNLCNDWIEVAANSSGAKKHNDRCLAVFMVAFQMTANIRMHETGQREASSERVNSLRQNGTLFFRCCHVDSNQRFLWPAD